MSFMPNTTWLNWETDYQASLHMLPAVWLMEDWWCHFIFFKFIFTFNCLVQFINLFNMVMYIITVKPGDLWAGNIKGSTILTKLAVKQIHQQFVTLLAFKELKLACVFLYRYFLRKDEHVFDKSNRTPKVG